MFRKFSGSVAGAQATSSSTKTGIKQSDAGMGPTATTTTTTTTPTATPQGVTLNAKYLRRELKDRDWMVSALALVSITTIVLVIWYRYDMEERMDLLSQRVKEKASVSMMKEYYNSQQRPGGMGVGAPSSPSTMGPTTRHSIAGVQTGAGSLLH